MPHPHPRRPRFCKFVSLLCIAFGFTGMSSSASAAPPLKIGLSLQEMNNPYFVTMKKAAEEAAASIGATLIGAMLLGVLNNGLNMIGVSPYVQNIIKGVIILLAIYISRERSKRLS